MGIFSRLFGSSTNQRGPVQRVTIARGRGYTFDVVGEASYQDALDAICGGKCEEGHNIECDAELRLIDDNPHDSNAIGVFIQGRLVGYIPRVAAGELRREINRLNPARRPMACSAKIVGGWDRGRRDQGHYGVKLNISSPLRLAG